MNYPNVTLKIRDFVPTLEFQNAEAETKEMFRLDQGIDTILMSIADDLGVSYTDAVDLFQLARNGEETSMDFGDIDYAADDWSTKHIREGARQMMTNGKRDYQDVEVSAEVDAALAEFWQANMMASVIEEIYALLIAKLIFSASELGIGTIVIDDDRREIRLQEKVGKEIGLALPEVELVVL